MRMLLLLLLWFAAFYGFRDGSWSLRVLDEHGRIAYHSCLLSRSWNIFLGEHVRWRPTLLCLLCLCLFEGRRAPSCCTTNSAKTSSAWRTGGLPLLFMVSTPVLLQVRSYVGPYHYSRNMAYYATLPGTTVAASRITVGR